MNCILDVNELTDDDGDSKDGNMSSSTVARKRRKRLVVATIGMLFVAAVLAGVLVNNSNNSDNTTMPSRANLQVSYTPPTKEQKLLDTAEQILTACSEEQLTQDKSDCESLCNGKMCCFEVETNEKSNCKEKDCPAYAGCESLLTGATKNVDQKVIWWG